MTRGPATWSASTGPLASAWLRHPLNQAGELADGQEPDNDRGPGCHLP